MERRNAVRLCSVLRKTESSGSALMHSIAPGAAGTAGAMAGTTACTCITGTADTAEPLFLS